MGFTEYIAPKRDRLLTKIARLVLEIGFETIRSSIMLQSYMISNHSHLQWGSQSTLLPKGTRIAHLMLKIGFEYNSNATIVYTKQSLPCACRSVNRVHCSHKGHDGLFTAEKSGKLR